MYLTCFLFRFLSVSHTSTLSHHPHTSKCPLFFFWISTWIGQFNADIGVFWQFRPIRSKSAWIGPIWPKSEPSQRESKKKIWRDTNAQAAASPRQAVSDASVAAVCRVRASQQITLSKVKFQRVWLNFKAKWEGHNRRVCLEPSTLHCSTRWTRLEL